MMGPGLGNGWGMDGGWGGWLLRKESGKMALEMVLIQKLRRVLGLLIGS